jgi:hypothetical protein
MKRLQQNWVPWEARQVVEEGNVMEPGRGAPGYDSMGLGERGIVGSRRIWGAKTKL